MFFRNIIVDIKKGLLIITMLIGHAAIDPTLRKIIYSFHMAAFIFLSGYFYKGRKSVRDEILTVVKSYLIPYIIFCVLHLLLHRKDILVNRIIYYMKQYICGMSFSNKILTKIPSIGPVYFTLVLIIIRLLYFLIEHLPSWIFVKKQSIILHFIAIYSV